MGRDELMNSQTHVMTQNLPVVYAFLFLYLSHILHGPIFYKRRILEGLAIQQLQPSLNKQFHCYNAKMKVATNIWSPCPRSHSPVRLLDPSLFLGEKGKDTVMCTKQLSCTSMIVQESFVFPHCCAGIGTPAASTSNQVSNFLKQCSSMNHQNRAV